MSVLEDRGGGAKRLAGPAVFLLAMALISPALAQPFADTPANHWVYDAIAELAAKGLIEGYPDGTFKGDRAMTRYEMAMVVARLLARIERIQVPAPAAAAAPKPEVTKQDIDMILRLVNEFRPELAAKNVRLSAVVEELNAIKARLDNVRISGALRFRYDDRRTSTGAAIQENPNAKAIDATASTVLNQALGVFKVAFDGSVTPDVHFILAVATNGFAVANSSSFGPPGQFTLGSVDNAFFDWKNAFGWPLEIWLGRFGGGGRSGITIGKVYPVQFGPFGLLMNTAGRPWTDSTGDSGRNVADGLRVALHLEDLADLQIQGLIVRINGNVGALSYPSGEDAYGIDASVKVMDGLRLGAYYVGNTIAQNGSVPFSQPPGAPSVLYHVYGPGGGSTNPATANCPAVPASALTTGGIACPAAGNGYGAYVNWEIVPGLNFDAEWAQWNDSVLGASDSGINAVLTLHLGTLLGVGHNVIITTGYQFYGVNFYPPYGATELDSFGDHFVYPGNGQGFTIGLSFVPVNRVAVFGTYLSGGNVSNSQSLQEFDAGIAYQFAPSARITLRYRQLRLNGVEQDQLFRAQVDYTF